ncbi:S9 family peptidase [Sediminitomix flava]|uniref:Dipeptidyl-peptidase-4 n=1 Tax=Sediminitomix flava TaxID=379075 RepID=A0A315ZF39_SEDFL|nr:S9 family peptidase [Sediminitomix flava]PWJ43354.1 dipeptidyl-peptidase-4 [Sediminitomix flava]
MRKLNFTILLMVLSVFTSFAQKNITLENIWSQYLFYPKSVNAVNWMKDGQFYTALANNAIVKTDVTTGKEVATLVEGDALSPALKIAGYEFSADEKQVLLLTDRESIYRRSFKAEYYVYDLESKELKKLSANGKQSYATFSPDGSKVAFVRENNLFYVDLASMEEKQVTTTGKFNHIINGSADWVYEEEFSFAKAFYWSPEGDKIAYLIFNETEVPEYNMQEWNHSMPYPTDYRFKYPKAGEKNSDIALSIFNLGDASTTDVELGTEKDIYIPRVQWTKDNNTLSVIRMNRFQNKLEILHVGQDGKGEVVLTEEADTYVDLDYCDELTYLEDGKHFVYTSETDGFKHIYLYKLNGELVRQITKGNWEVKKLVGVDENAKRIYYISTEASPMQKDFYSIDYKGGKKTKLSKKAGNTTVNMSRDFKYYISYHSSSEEVPTVSLFAVKRNAEIKVLENNEAFKNRVADFNYVKKEMFSFTPSHGMELHGYMLKPADFDESKKYPVLMFQYSGPGSEQVADKWGGGNFAWHQMLTQKGYIVAVVDGRGTGNKGRAFKHATYRQLGKLEVEDQITSAQYLAEMPYIDASRIGIWGWSYGGYMSSNCIMQGADTFKMAIAVAPVTTWRLYDTIYTERYLQRPQDNAAGYDENSPINHVDKLKGKFLLIHGTGDDNVHVQNAFLLQNALIGAGKQFDSFYYPDRNHGIYGGNTRLHLYTLMTDYVMNNL